MWSGEATTARLQRRTCTASTTMYGSASGRQHTRWLEVVRPAPHTETQRVIGEMYAGHGPIKGEFHHQHTLLPALLSHIYQQDRTYTDCEHGVHQKFIACTFPLQ